MFEFKIFDVETKYFILELEHNIFVNCYVMLKYNEKTYQYRNLFVRLHRRFSFLIS